MCFHSRSLEVSIEIYCTRTGTFVRKYRKECKMRISEEVVMGSQIWLLRLVIMVLLVMVGV
jgi:hypothetical protein